MTFSCVLLINLPSIIKRGIIYFTLNVEIISNAFLIIRNVTSFIYICVCFFLLKLCLGETAFGLLISRKLPVAGTHVLIHY